jgi:hypothetical protein
LNGIQEVDGSIPFSSTNHLIADAATPGGRRCFSTPARHDPKTPVVTDAEPGAEPMHGHNEAPNPDPLVGRTRLPEG